MKKVLLTVLSVAVITILVLGCAEEDSDYEIGVSCEDVDGFCTDDDSIMCPSTYEPHSDTGDPGLDCGGHCCVTAPKTHCNNESGMNCLPGVECPMFWEPVQGQAICEEGRICCFWLG